MIDRFEIFTSSITQIYRCINKIKSAEMTEYGLKGQHVMCIYNLAKHSGGITAAQLCTMCGEDKAAISRTLLFLENKGFILCEKEGSKKYRAKITLSEEGIKIAEEINNIVDNTLLTVGSFLSDEERNQFYETLNKISDNLAKICE